jgi:hypothetical protein
MKTNIPSFELNGKTYTFKRNRFLLAELDQIKNENSLSPEEEQTFVVLQDCYNRLAKLQERVKELEDTYYETFSEEDGEIYEKAKLHYERQLMEITQKEVEANGLSKKVEKQAIDNMEKLIIIALQKDDEGKNIRTAEEANKIWCDYVDEIGTSNASEWLIYAFNYITGNDDEENSNPFVAQAKAKAEQRARNRQEGFKKIR